MAGKMKKPIENRVEGGVIHGNAALPQGAVALPRNTYVVQMKVLDKPEPIRAVKRPREK
jgi:hypothetical protein